jgi:hypothetical protein
MTTDVNLGEVSMRLVLIFMKIIAKLTEQYFSACVDKATR